MVVLPDKLSTPFDQLPMEPEDRERSDVQTMAQKRALTCLPFVITVNRTGYRVDKEIPKAGLYVVMEV